MMNSDLDPAAQSRVSWNFGAKVYPEAAASSSNSLNKLLVHHRLAGSHGVVLRNNVPTRGNFDKLGGVETDA